MKKIRSRFEWEGSCQEPSFALWGTRPPDVTDQRYCMYGSLKKMRVKFETADCFQNEKMFMCEESHGACLYDVKYKAFGNIMASLHIENASVSICKIACDNFVSETGHRCSGFNYNDVIKSCGLMTSDNLYRLDKYHRPSDSNHQMFIKRCDIQAVLETTNTKFRRLCPLVPISQCATNRRLCNDSYDESPPEFGECVCKCHKPTTKLNLTEIIEHIVDTIRIPPKNTSIAIRQKISVDDSRMSSRGIGYVAIAIMSTIFGGIILMDLNTLRMHLT
ncbi:uncharacterized protein LOC133192341 [Saccostrea echinata]|uniref:uncharacterized protein LOC133192341 n=1 Tax=Saccostrea echinata TaxID=191078 RepID=UPI002A83BBCC|nr:uncharacterized protein LOC133192341 [Saccostrea echinata]